MLKRPIDLKPGDIIADTDLIVLEAYCLDNSARGSVMVDFVGCGDGDNTCYSWDSLVEVEDQI